MKNTAQNCWNTGERFVKYEGLISWITYSTNPNNETMNSCMFVYISMWKIEYVFKASAVIPFYE